MRRRVSCAPREGTRRQQQRDSGEDHRPPADAIGQPSEYRRERVHPGDVKAEHQADDAEGVCGIVSGTLDVHGRHRHHADHHHVSNRHGAHAQTGSGVRRYEPEGGPHSRLGGVRGWLSGPSQLVPRHHCRVGSQEHQQQHDGQRKQERREEVGARQGGDAEPADRSAGHRCQARAQHRPERGCPYYQGKMTPSQSRRRQIHGGIAGLEVGGGGCAKQKESREQEGYRSASRGYEDDDRAGRSDQVEQREARPPPAMVDDRRRRDGKESSADHRGALRQTGHAHARNVSREQRADRRAYRHPDPADDLRDEEQPQRTALDVGDFHGTNSRRYSDTAVWRRMGYHLHLSLRVPEETQHG